MQAIYKSKMVQVFCYHDFLIYQLIENRRPTATVASGGSISGTVVVGAAEVSSGGQATGTVLSGGGTLTVDAGGSASGTQIAFDSQENLFGSDASATVSGSLNIFSGAVANGTDVAGGGTLFVSGGTVDDAMVIGAVSAVSAAFVSGGLVSGSVDIGAGASASSLQIDGVLTVEFGGAISGVVISSGGTLDVANGAQRVERKSSSADSRRSKARTRMISFPATWS